MRTAVLYSHFAKTAARLTARPGAFLICVLAVATWAVTGPVFGYSDTWQLVINTSTTIVTFLMVFLIQNTQTRDTEAMHVKLDELIRANREASNALIDLEELEEEELQRFHARYQALANAARAKLAQERQPASTRDA